jgi:hypothetical protein
MSLPAITNEAAVFRSATSAERLTVVCEVELLLPGTESAVAEVSIEAVLARSPPSA